MSWWDTTRDELVRNFPESCNSITQSFCHVPQSQVDINMNCNSHYHNHAFCFWIDLHKEDRCACDAWSWLVSAVSFTGTHHELMMSCQYLCAISSEKVFLALAGSAGSVSNLTVSNLWWAAVLIRTFTSRNTAAQAENLIQNQGFSWFFLGQKWSSVVADNKVRRANNLHECFIHAK